MIYGIGTDICDIRRIRASFERHGERFAEKILTANELATWRTRSQRWPERGLRYLATRFSAVVYGAMQAWMQERQLHAWISLTDETDYAASFCVVERR